MLDYPKNIPDVDLDVSDRDLAVSVLDNFVIASQIQEKQGEADLVIHKTGLYFQQIPKDTSTGLAAFPYDVAEELGYYKVDVISNHVYDLVDSNEHLEQLLNSPTDWKWFQDRRFFNNNDNRYRVTHLSNYYDLWVKYPPKSVEDVAILISVIRPRKRYLIGQPLEAIRKVIWKKLDEENPDNDSRKYFFKKSHGIAFALLVMVHMQLIAKQLGISQN